MIASVDQFPRDFDNKKFCILNMHKREGQKPSNILWHIFTFENYCLNVWNCSVFVISIKCFGCSIFSPVYWSLICIVSHLLEEIWEDVVQYSITYLFTSLEILSFWGILQIFSKFFSMFSSNIFLLVIYLWIIFLDICSKLEIACIFFSMYQLSTRYCSHQLSTFSA